MKKNTNQGQRGKLPIGKAEDVEFSEEMADAADKEAQARAAAADQRAERG